MLSGQWREGVFTGCDNVYTYPSGQSLLRGVWDEDGVMGATTAWHVVRFLMSCWATCSLALMRTLAAISWAHFARIRRDKT